MNFSFKEMLDWTLRKPLVVIAIILAITLLFAWQIRHLSFKTSIYDLQIENLPETARYEDFKKLFGSDEIIRVVVKAENIFDSLTYSKIEQLAERATQIDGVRRVISLPGIKKAVDVTGNWDMEKFSAVISGVDLFKNNLFSTDGKTTALTLVLKNEALPEDVINDVRLLIAETSSDLSLYQIGMPLVSEALVKLTEKDFSRLPPVTLLLIAIILLCLFRKLRYILIPLICVGLALTWTFGLMALLRIPLSMLTMIVPVFLIAVGTAYCLHIVSEYIACQEETGSPKEVTTRTFSHIAFPTFLAVLTTIIGLGSLFINRIAMIQEFALFSCFGMLSILVIILTFLPAAMSLMPVSSTTQKKEEAPSSLFQRFIDIIIDLNLNHQKVTLPIIAVVVLICLIGILRIRVETNPVGYFKENTEIKRNFNDIYQHLSGSFPINVAMENAEADYFQDPAHLAEIERLQVFLEKLPGVDKTISFADYLKLVNYALNKFEHKHYVLPQEGFEVRMAINNYPTMLGEDMLTRFMNPEFSKTNILLLTHVSSSKDFLHIRDKITEHVKQHFSKDLKWDVTGLGMTIAVSSELLTSGQVKSLSITMVLVFAIMFALFLSSKVGLIALVPNIFPIVINFGIMGWFGVELSMVTSLIASIAIGLAVDDTIHYLVRYNREFKTDLDEKRAIRETLTRVGRPVTFTTVTICVGFSILIFSSFKPTAIFGVMMVITSLAALVGDLIVLPSLIQHVEVVTLWDLLRLKLGKEPPEGIPLFKGLSHTQVHYIIMAGSLMEINAGEILFHKGEPSDSMYAIVSGTLDVLDPDSDDESNRELGSHKLLNQIKTGDVLGEMGFLRSVPRSATVIATQPVELLKINWKMIKRLQWLYPPTAQKFFFNLMTLICDRLENLTECFSEIKVLDDSTGLYDRDNFLKILDAEIERAKRYQAGLAVSLLKFDFDAVTPARNNLETEGILREMGEAFSEQIRKCDTLSRFDHRTFALLMPHSSAAKAELLCNRLMHLFEEKCNAVECMQLRLTAGSAEFIPGSEESGFDLIAKASVSLQNAVESDTSVQ
ncbi:MAG: efflux RND transporter permease subunit [Desulfobacterales bacterium]